MEEIMSMPFEKVYRLNIIFNELMKADNDDND